MAMQHHTHCLNCEAPLRENDRFCPNCGQEDRNLEISFWEFIKDYLSSNFNFDTKLGRTITDLVLKPGKITHEYLAGKRTSYVKPLQVYFFVSFVYFMLLGYSIRSGNDERKINQTEVELNSEQSAIVQDSNTVREYPIISLSDDSALDSLSAAIGGTEKPWKRHVISQLSKLSDPTSEDTFTRELFANLSLAMFLLMPLFAFILWVFNRKTSGFYMNALVFSIHYHSVAFILFSIDMLIGFAFNRFGTTVFFIALTLIYLLLAMKRVYGYSFLKNLGKFIKVTTLYSLFLGLAFICILTFSVLRF